MGTGRSEESAEILSGVWRYLRRERQTVMDEQRLENNCRKPGTEERRMSYGRLAGI
jgi:hypothetical protein